MIILLDAGPLGLISNPRSSNENEACRAWVESLLSAQHTVIVPEIADYEVRRELLRGNKRHGIEKLDQLKITLDYLPLTTNMMLQAAEFWAECRRLGQPTADNHALDADVILAAQASAIQAKGNQVLIATTNPKHLTRFVPAQDWTSIGSP